MTESARVLNWRSRHDPRSRNFPARALTDDLKKIRKWRVWIPPTVVLDQGEEGACVGYAWAGELGASPVRIPGVSNELAQDIYVGAKGRDEWPGEAYVGTSVLAGAQECQARGYIGQYRWTFGIDELRDAVIYLGPAVIGIPWLDTMYQTRPSGLVETAGGSIVGGHCILVYGYHPKMRIKGEGWGERHDVFLWRNSWGQDYGNNGTGYVRREDLAVLLAGQGESCIPLQRSRPLVPVKGI